MTSILRSFARSIADTVSRFSRTSKLIFSILLFIALGSVFSIISHIDSRVSVTVPGYGGIITEGVIGAPKIINPLLEVTGTTRDISSLIFAGLTMKESSGTYAPVLAQTIEQATSTDGRSSTYTFTLRPNALFHDGRAVTAQDIEFTYALVTNPAVRSPLGNQYDGVTVRIVDDRTVSMTFTNVHDPLSLTTLGILPRHIYESVPPTDFGLAEYHAEPIGAGPFRLHSVRRDSAGIPIALELRRFSEFALGKPFVRSYVFSFYKNESELLEAFQSGDITSVGGLSPQNASILIQGNYADAYSEYALPRVFALFFNQSKNKALGDENVRAALALTAPRERIVEDVLGSFGKPSTSPLPAHLEPGLRSGTSSATSTRSNAQIQIEAGSTSIEVAESILDKAGYTKNEEGRRARKVGNETIPLAFVITTGSTPDLEATASLLKEAWEQIGAAVTLRMYEPSDLNQNVIRRRDYEALLFGQVIAKDDDLAAFWHSNRRADPGLNVSLYANPRVDRALDELTAAGTLDAQARTERLSLIKNEILRDNPAVFLYSPSYIYITPIQYDSAVSNSIETPAERLRNTYRGHLKTERIWPMFRNILGIL